MYCICKKLFSILSVSICIIYYIPIYSNDKVSLFVGDKPFKEWFNDKKNNKKLKPIFENNDQLHKFVIKNDKEDIKIKKDDGLYYGTYSYNKLDINEIKRILNINGDDFIILLDNVYFLYDDEEDNSSSQGLIAILLQNNDYEIIEISIRNDNKNSIIDKANFRLCRSIYFSVYKIDLKDLGFKMNEIKPVAPPIINQPVQPVQPVVKPIVTTPVVQPVKSVAVKPIVTTPVVKPIVNPPVVHPVTTPVVQPVQPIVNTPVVKPVKNIDPGVSNKGNSNKSNSNNNNVCSCKSEIKITS